MDENLAHFVGPYSGDITGEIMGFFHGGAPMAEWKK
jgi:hypothetical protein